MKLSHCTLALVAGALALQAAPCQGVTMTVRSGDLSVGRTCEPFDCVPHKLFADAGAQLDCEIYGRRGTYYALLGGMETVGCQPIAGIGGLLALGSPVFGLGFGGVGDFQAATDCDVGVGATTFMVPAGAAGLRFRLQGVSYSPVDVGLAFSRAVEISVR